MSENHAKDFTSDPNATLALQRALASAMGVDESLVAITAIYIDGQPVSFAYSWVDRRLSHRMPSEDSALDSTVMVEYTVTLLVQSDVAEVLARTQHINPAVLTARLYKEAEFIGHPILFKTVPTIEDLVATTTTTTTSTSTTNTSTTSTSTSTPYAPALLEEPEDSSLLYGILGGIAMIVILHCCLLLVCFRARQSSAEVEERRSEKIERYIFEEADPSLLPKKSPTHSHSHTHTLSREMENATPKAADIFAATVSIDAVSSSAHHTAARDLAIVAEGATASAATPRSGSGGTDIDMDDLLSAPADEFAAKASVSRSDEAFPDIMSYVNELSAGNMMANIVAVYNIPDAVPERLGPPENINLDAAAENLEGSNVAEIYNNMDAAAGDPEPTMSSPSGAANLIDTPLTPPSLATATAHGNSKSILRRALEGPGPAAITERPQRAAINARLALSDTAAAVPPLLASSGTNARVIRWGSSEISAGEDQM